MVQNLYLYIGMTRTQQNGATEATMTEQTMRQTVNDLNSHSGPAYFITLAGGRYDGRMKPVTGPDLILFTDPVTRTTLALREPDVTIGTVWRKLQEKRAQFQDQIVKQLNELGEAR
jgi:hypothetical protein